MRVLLENRENGHFKDYELIGEVISPTEATITIRFGRIGGAKQQSTATVPIGEMESRIEKTAAEKLRKGYVLVEARTDDGSWVSSKPAEPPVEAEPVDVDDLEEQLRKSLEAIGVES